MSDVEQEIGTCCSMLQMALAYPVDVPTLFVDDGMLWVSSGYVNQSAEGPYWQRFVARHCPFCGKEVGDSEDK
jgi:hypothetical protein